jgi:5'-3' exonuclease
MAERKTKKWVSTIKRRLAILQMFPDVNDEPNQMVLSEIFDIDRSSINLDLKCIREIRGEIAGLTKQYEEKLNGPTTVRPMRRKKWGRRVATVFGGTKETFQNEKAPERQDDERPTHEDGTNPGGSD